MDAMPKKFTLTKKNTSAFPSLLPVSGVSILISYGEKPLCVKLPIFSEFMENSTKFMKNSGLTKWTQNLR